MTAVIRSVTSALAGRGRALAEPLAHPDVRRLWAAQLTSEAGDWAARLVAGVRAYLRALADGLGLIRTGSSDYHGTNKRTPIAACTTEPEQYDALLAAGVRLWSYGVSMLHAKVVTVDGAVAGVGSANFTGRSLMLDDEVNLVVFDPAVVRALDDDFEADLAVSAPVDPQQWPERGLAQRALEVVAGLGGRHM
jgi:hypothetical protein